MAEVINGNVFDANKKFVDFAGLDYFWEKAKNYVDGVDNGLTARIKANEDAIAGIQDELDTISGGVGSVGTQIDNKIAALDLPNNYDSKGSADQALVDAKAYADGLNTAMDTRVKAVEEGVAGIDSKITNAFNDFSTKVTDDNVVNSYKELIDYAAEHGSEFTALVGVVDAKADKTYVDGLAGNYDSKGSADQALVDAKAYADGLNTAMDTRVKAVESFDHSVYAKSADVYAKDAVDTKVADAQAAAIAQAKLDAADALKSYYTKTEVDNLLTTNSTGDRAYAKQYTDELFGSFKFADNSDIDAIFA